MKLYHFSENPDIQRFVPRQLPYRLHEPAMVWAIDERRACNYYFPRDCPRVCFWTEAETTAEDRERFFGFSRASHIVAVEAGWLDRIRDAKLYRYAFEPGPFESYDGNAGYYVARHEVEPASVERVDDCLGLLAAAGVEVRVTPSLHPLKEALPASTVNFSMIRMANARPEP
ncbi:hypothetical protein SAMN02799624_00466 [Paenibacillus sp. UNC496MF]|uniref:DUF6886 family protein n=1 Tax=Paenibacillus sp. UNC496MF TaxID=1502753 RepID=UPI0008E2C456|nr:DUF6886 family protein [Paenibacillus sp. UNC496MF]SFI34202.1 hypothetical protein SAMN02799624_00466 [Paenibacillus sp. UNC496MF]